ncbi:MAG: hypothetical protein V4610_17680 [Pseudomonadota bacterium]|jgi:hypothetical protein|uniref:DUF4139 domain-containing protein n=1 Tax=hydrothermal vent metagenome TaxID=652676 RepID=A0A160TI95_9ZZZZ
MRGRGAAILLLVVANVPVAGQTMVESDRVDAVSVTLYRDPARGEGAIPPDWPAGYALVTETRTVAIPAGRSVIRFEGVSEGMLPESAIVTGLPRRVNEKNRDARLLSPAALVDAYLKRRVTIRRTSRRTGATTTGEAIIQSGPGGGVLLTTADGVEALSCSGLPESLSYPGVPADLSAKPTLSVVTDSVAAASATVQLSYLAQGFDWSAHYVARLGEDGKTLDLFAWLTIANGGSQGFADAHTQAVAGAPNKEANAKLPAGPAPDLHLQCWPMDITSTHPRWGIDRLPAPAPPGLVQGDMEGSDIVVTASAMKRGSYESAEAVSVVTAVQEELGDLKLYRIPERVTVAARSRKQVAMIDRKGVRFERIHSGTFEEFDYDRNGEPESVASALLLRTENRDTNGLGLPLPAGGVALFESVQGASLLVAESTLRDRAVGDEVEVGAGESSDVRYTIVARPGSERRKPYSVRVTNARATPAVFELPIPYKIGSASVPLFERKGVKTWRVTVPANGEAKLDFALKLETAR